MNRVLSAIKLDYYASKSMLKLISFLVLVGIVLGVVTHGPDYMMMFIMVFGVTSSGSVFSVHEKNHSDKLYGILPLSKSEMILGRYLYALIIGAVYIIVAGILGLIMSKVMNGSVNALSYWATIAVAFIYFCFATAVVYPVYLKFSFAKAYVFAMMPMYIIAVLFLIFTRKTDVMGNLAAAVKFYAAHVYMLPVTGLIAGLALLTLSVIIANLIYTRKEI